MPEKQNEPILPIPSALYREMAGFYERIDQLRDELGRMQERYYQLGEHPESLAADNLGEPIDPVHAPTHIRCCLGVARQRLTSVADVIDEAREYGSRLKLTDAADAERERRLAQQRRARRTR